MKKKWFLLLFLAVAYSSLCAQPHLSWHNYSFSQRVTEIEIAGNDIWISTQGGLVKYNKLTKEKKYFNRANSNLPDNNLLSVLLLGDNTLWLGGKYYGAGKFNHIKCDIFNEANSGLSSNQHNTSIKTDKDGNIWIASSGSITKFDGKKWKEWHLSYFQSVIYFDIDKNGVVWTYSTDGIGKIENDEYDTVLKIGEGAISPKMGYIKVDNEQTVWLAVFGKGLYKYDGTTAINYSTDNSCLSTNDIYSIVFDSQNKMWLATNEGLVNFNFSTCNTYSPPEADKMLLRLKTTNSDTIWCGAFSGKLLCFDGTNFSSVELSNSPLKDNYIMDIFVDNANTKWIGTEKNLVKKTSEQFSSEFDGGVSAVVQDNSDAIWLAFYESDTCLLKIEGDKKTIFDSINFPLNTSKIMVKDLVVDKNNNLWISTKKGLFKYDGQDFTTYTVDNSAIPSNELFELKFDDENNLWGGSANGLFKFNNGLWTVWNTENSLIPTNVVPSLFFDSEQNLWFSCMDESRTIGIDFGGGLTRFNGTTMTTYNIQNSGLLSNTIFDIHIDKDDLIWLATCGRGLMSFDKQNKWQSYNVTNSGIANNIVQKITQDKDGYLWLGHIDAGVSMFDPASFILDVDDCIEIDDNVFYLFPNPVQDKLTILFSEQQQAALITLKTISGSTVFLKELENTDRYIVNTQNYSSGVYLFSVKTDSKIITKKIIIK